jgi:hypothetical protein
MRMPITRPRIASLAERSMSAASGVTQKLCATPEMKSSGSPAAAELVCPKARSAMNPAPAPASEEREQREDRREHGIHSSRRA